MIFFPLLFSYLNDREIPYALLRNYDDLPGKVLEGSDVDLLVDRKYKDKYFFAVKEVAEKTGSLVLLKSDRKNCLSYLIYNNEFEPSGVWLDAFWEMSSKSFIWADSDYLLKSRVFNGEKRFFTLSEGCEAATLFAKEIFNSVLIKDRYKPKISGLVLSDKEGFIKTLTSYLGKKNAKEMADICERSDWEKATERRRAWFYGLILKSFLRRNFIQIIDLLRFGLGYFKKILFKKGISIVLMGPDGVGKTAVSESTEENFKNFYFNKIYKYHGHFGFFPEWGRIYRIFSKRSAHEEALPREEKKVSAARGVLSVLYYGLEHILARPWIALLKARGNLIIFDRYFYDFAVMNSSSLAPEKAFRFLNNFIHRPDLLFVFRADPEIIFERKKELSKKEIVRQDEIFRDKKISKFAPTVFVNAEESIGAVSGAVKKEILKELSRKTI
jgi:thymidylate kinase